MAQYAANVEQAHGRWEIYFPQLPGCLAVGATRQLAEEAAPAAIGAYLAWCRELARARSPEDPEPEILVEELAREWVYPQDPRHTVQAFFASDSAPLVESEVDQLIELLAWSRDDLGQAVSGLTEAERTWESGEGWSISDVVDHIGRTEWWYLDRIGLAPSAYIVPGTALHRLNIAREQLVGVLPSLVGVAGVVEHRGELWSPRKALRRALCHERDHTDQILALRAQVARGVAED